MNHYFFYPLFLPLFSLFLSFSLYANSTNNCTFNTPLTLSELVDIALQNNPSTKQAWWNANRAAANLGIANSNYYPNVGINGNVTNGRTFKFVNGPNTQYTIVGADLTLSMMLYDFGATKASVNSAKAALLAADWQNDWTIQKVMIKVLESAYTALHAQEIVKAALISLEEAKKVLYSAEQLNQAGLRAISDVYTSQANVSEMKMDLYQQQALLDIQYARLASAIGVRANTPLTLAPLEDLNLPTNTQLDNLIEIALNQRTDLMARQARLSESLANKAKANAGYFPTVSLYSRGGMNHAFHDRANGGHYQVALNLDYSLFDGFQTMYQNRVAYSDVQLSMESLAELELEIILEVFSHSRSLQASQQILPEAIEYLKSSENSYTSTLEKYRAGKESIAELSNAQQQLAIARLRYNNVKTQMLISSANLSYATGTLSIGGASE